MPDAFEACARAIHETAARRGWAVGRWEDQTDDHRLICRAFANAAINRWEATGWRRVLLQTSFSVSRRRRWLATKCGAAEAFAAHIPRVLMRIRQPFL